MNIYTLHQQKQDNKKIAMLTAYDASFAALMNETDLDAILVGDTLGNVIQGGETTLTVDIEHIIYHTRCVAKTAKNKIILADMPFMSYACTQMALSNAAKLMQAGAHMIKMEGGAWLCETIARLTECGVPVCGHLGLTPQLVYTLGGYKIQGKTHHQAEKILDDAVLLEKAGAALIVLECIPPQLAEEITRNLSIPTIGIGAGKDCDGQIMVLYDILGISAGHIPKFAKNFMLGQSSIQAAIAAYVSAVKAQEFPQRVI